MCIYIHIRMTYTLVYYDIIWHLWAVQPTLPGNPSPSKCVICGCATCRKSSFVPEKKRLVHMEMGMGQEQDFLVQIGWSIVGPRGFMTRVWLPFFKACPVALPVYMYKLLMLLNSAGSYSKAPSANPTTLDSLQHMSSQYKVTDKTTISFSEAEDRLCRLSWYCCSFDRHTTHGFQISFLRPFAF